MDTRSIIINVPEYVFLAAHTDKTGFTHQLAEAAAVKLYEVGQLSSGRAAQLAGMSRVEFLDLLSRYKVFPLESELCNLEAGNA